ncbi:MAG: protein kinase [Planctomycetaceae bacterium]
MTRSPLDLETQYSQLLAEYDEALATASDESTVFPQSFVSHLADVGLQQRFDRIQGCLRLLDQDRRRQAVSSAHGEATQGKATNAATINRTGTKGEPAGPSQIGRFRVIRRLGSGGFGVVFLAEDPVLQRQVAIKMPLASIFQSQELHARFLRECRAAAKLVHPGIVRVLESGDIHGVPYQVAEFVDGERLSDLLKREKLSVRTAAVMVRNLADAIQHAHDHGVLHRDIKPDNILLQTQHAADDCESSCESISPDLLDSGSCICELKFESTSARAFPSMNAAQPSGSLHYPTNSQKKAASIKIKQPALIPRITDFGLARIADDDTALSRSGMLVGTPKYMSPEQLKGQTTAHGPQSDIYSLGVVLYELLAGHVPFPEAQNLHARIAIADHAVPAIPSQQGHAVDGDLELICRRCLEVDPARRYSSAAELSVDLQRFIAGQLIHHRRWLPGRVLEHLKTSVISIAVMCCLGAIILLTQKPSIESDEKSGNAMALLSNGGNTESQVKWAASPESTSSIGAGRLFSPDLPVLILPLKFQQSAITIEAWIKPGSQGGTLLSIGGIIGLGLTSIDGHLGSAIHVPPTEGSFAVIYSATRLEANVWHHLAATYDSGRFQLFIDGRLVPLETVLEGENGETTYPEVPFFELQPLWPDSVTTIGANDIGSSLKHRYPFSGRIREVRISSGNLYSNDFVPPQTLPVEEPTMALYRLDDNHQTFKDESGHLGPAVIFRNSSN